MNFQKVSLKLWQVVLCLTMLLVSFQIEALAAGNGGAKESGDKQPGLWTLTSKENLPSGNRRLVVPRKYSVFSLNQTLLTEEVADAPLEFTSAAAQERNILEIPTPEGKLMRFRIEESPVLLPQDANFLKWKTYQGQGIDDPTAIVRFDWTSSGFHAFVSGANGAYFIDPYAENDRTNYVVYYKEDASFKRSEFFCEVKSGGQRQLPKFANPFDFSPDLFSNGAQLRTFRIAVAATGEYTNFFRQAGDSDQQAKQRALNQIVVSINRINLIFRRDLAVTFALVPNNSDIVFTDPATDPYTNDDADADTDTNQRVLDGTFTGVTGIGSANYDIGHVVSITPSPNGLAASPSLCNNGGKAQGFTGSSNAAGDGFDVDYFAHEIGHQFGMSHTFNNNADGSCATREPNSAYEPASGVTIMGYAGICAPRNLAANSIEYFHARSFVETLDYLPSVTACGGTAASNNTPPTGVSAGLDYTIPKQTPFVLTASARDTDLGLTYSWEEYDLGAATNSLPGAPPNGSLDTDEDGNVRPIFRSYNPSTQPFRMFPHLYYILNNDNTPPLSYTGKLPFAPATGSTAGYNCPEGETCVTGERLPSIARTMNFRVTVRDNNANAGGVADATTQITIDAASGPFRVTSQNSSPAAWQGGSQQTITWNVAGTNNAAVNAQNVKISLSADGGNTFPFVLSNSTPNDGSEVVTIPNNATTQARIKIEAENNVFFDISNANFTVTAASPTAARTYFDFDGDGKADISVFRPENRVWYELNSTSGFTSAQFGIATDKIVPADYDGDKKTDIAVWRESEGNFYIFNSSDRSVRVENFGIAGDKPIIGDWDGDGRADLAVYREGAQGVFYYRGSKDNPNRNISFLPLGSNGDKPVRGDFDGDGKLDAAVFRPSNGVWYILQSSNNQFRFVNFGLANDTLVPADYDGDSKTDIAVYRNGVWYILQSQTGQVRYESFGLSTDKPAPADFDGDGKTDVAVFRPDAGIWYQLRSTSGFSAVKFGTANDKPIPSAYIY